MLKTKPLTEQIKLDLPYDFSTGISPYNLLKNNFNLFKDILFQCKTIKEFSQRTGLPVALCYSFAKRCGYKKQEKYDINEIERLYNSGQSLKQIGQRFKISARYVLTLMQKYNIPRRPASKRFNTNDNYFSVLGPEQAYWAGLLVADGNIGSDRYFSITLKEDDKQILIDFQTAIDTEKRLYYREPFDNHSGAYSLLINSAKMVSDLYKYYNLTPNKSLTIMPPNIYDDKLIIPFFKGLLDGDGTIGYYSTGKEKQYFTIQFLAGTSNLANWICDNINRLLNIEKKYFRLGKIYGIKLTGNSAIKLYNIIKPSVKYGLNRKWRFVP